ncbi:MAG: DUF1800 family protein [Candidatus Sulfotelmatobacter sp.]
MRFGVIKPALFLLTLSLACAVPHSLAKKKDQAAASGLNEQKRAVHALNRLTFGPRPGDLQQVMAMGVDKWIDLQLHPEGISNSALEARLAPFRTLRMNSREMVEEFPDNQMVREVMDGKRPMPSDPARRAVYQVQIARLLEKKEAREERKAETAIASAPPPASDAAKTGARTGPNSGEDRAAAADAGAAGTAKTAEELAAAAAASPDAMPATPADNNLAPAASSQMPASNAPPAASPSNAPANDMPMAAPGEAASGSPAGSNTAPVDDFEARRREERLYADLEVQNLADLPPDQRYKKVLSMSAERQVAFADSLRGGKGQEFLAGLDPRQKETLQAMNNPQSVITDELVQAKLLRAIYSERQLEEVMTDFWFNHFNVFIGKGADRVLLTSYEQEVIRPHALGKFEDLLVATAKSPAMLFYLDNWLSTGPNSMQALGIPGRPGPNGPYRFPRQNPNARPKQNSGLNENYGRELLELHTLSVNGGYSQRDVTEVAKVFTGWTVDKPNEGGDFRYDPRRHEPGPKFFLGHRIKPKGEEEGREVLHMLATSPQTAHFISLKLAQRFVSDDPPPALVDRLAKTFQKKKGDIREVLSALFHSPEFWDESSYRAKVKTPLEFVASAARATGADVEDAMPLANQINRMGMPLYGAQPPTGYSMKAETWVSSSALLNRMNFALALTAGKVRGVKVDAVQLAGGPPSPDADMALSVMEGKLLAADVSPQTHNSIVAQIQAPPKTAAAVQPDKGQPEKDQPGKYGPQRKPADAARPPGASMIAGLLLGSPEFQRR